MKTDPSDGSAVRFVDDVIALAVRERASDIHFEPYGGDMIVRFRIDGILRRVRTVPRELRERVVSRLKVLAWLDLTERRRPQDGRASFSDRVDLRVSTLPTLHGETVVLRVLSKPIHQHGAERLGLEGETLRRYRQLLHANGGLILIAGPTGSGKTTTMYEMIASLSGDAVNVVTLEDPVEYDVSGTNQTAIGDQGGMTFPIGIRSVLRQDPDVVAIGEIRDEETAEAAYRAAISGRLTIATVHARSAASIPGRLDNLGIRVAMLAETLRGVIIQQLARRVCGQCGDAGCERCGGSGCFGRVGVFGVAVFPDAAPMTAERLAEADGQLAERLRSLAARGEICDSEVEHVLGAV